MINVLIDKSGDLWFELVHGLYTWALGEDHVDAAFRCAEVTWPGDETVNRTREELDAGSWAPFS
jgi:hypothetical protein